MINKEEMLVLLRSVAVPEDVEQGMGHAFDLGVDWERERVLKVLAAWANGPSGQPEMFDIMQDIKLGNEY